MAGKSSLPCSCIWQRRCTPVVVSSVTPLTLSPTRDHFWLSSPSVRLSSVRITRSSSLSAVEGSGAAPARSYSAPLWTSSVASPPSSRIMFGSPSGHVRACSVHHQYSSRLSPFQAKTGMPFGSSAVPSGPTTTAAAAWSCVEKMLQLHQRTSAPSAASVSMRTAVWIVMCSEPVMRAPASGWASAYSLRIAMRPGISCSARVISCRPYAASDRSEALKSFWVRVVAALMRLLYSGQLRRSGQQLLVLVLLPAQPVAGRYLGGPLRLGLEPRLDRAAHLVVAPQAQGEPDVSEADLVLRQQLAQGPQALELRGAVQAVARRGARRLDEADALDVSQHARRPARGLGGLVDGEGVHEA